MKISKRDRAALSDKSLAAVFKWAEDNPGLLAEAYMNACMGCGDAGRDILRDLPGGGLTNRRAWNLAWEAQCMAFQSRDLLGRLVLDRIAAAGAQHQEGG